MADKYKRLRVVRYSKEFAKAVDIVEDPIPTPNADQIRVRNLYAGVNAGDVYLAAGHRADLCTLPFDLGHEAISVVDAVGENVAMKLGQHVIYMGSSGYSQYAIASPAEVVPISEPKPEYIAFAISGLTAAVGLEEAARIQKGETVLITAAAGGCGHIAVQWAKAKGCHVIGTCSSADKADYLKSIGCDCVINYKDENLDEVLLNKYPKGIDVIWETIGGPTTAILFKHLAVKGRLVIIGSTTGYLTNEGISQLYISNLSQELLGGSKQIMGFLLLHYTDKYVEYRQQLVAKYKKGEIKVRIDMGESFGDSYFKGIKDVVKAIQYLHSGKSLGKVVVELSE